MEQVFELLPSALPIKDNIQAMDVYDNMLCYADPKGFVHLYQLHLRETEVVAYPVEESNVACDLMGRSSSLLRPKV